MEAARLAKREVVRMLLCYDANPELTDEVKNSPVLYLSKTGLTCHFVSQNGWSAVSYAAQAKPMPVDILLLFQPGRIEVSVL